MALGLQDSSAIMSELGGPSDFTENILFYMLHDAKQPNVTEPTTISGEQKQALEEYISGDDPFSSSPDARNSPSNLVVTAGPKVDGPMARDHDDVHSEPSPSLRPTSRLHARAEDNMESPARQRGRRSASSSAIGDTLRRSKMRLPEINTAHDRNEMDQMNVVISLERSLKLLRQELESVKWKSAEDIRKLKNETQLLQRTAAESNRAPIVTSSQGDAEIMAKLSLSEERIAKLLQENNAMRLEMHQLNDKHAAELETQKAAHDSRIADLQLQLSSAQSSTNTNNTRTGALESQVMSLQSMLDRADDESAQHAQELRTLDSQIKSLQSIIDAADGSVQQAKDLHALESQVRSLQSMLNTADESAQQAREDLQEERRSSESRIENLQDQLSLTETRYLDAKDRIDDLNGELSSLRASAQQTSNDELRKVNGLLQKERKEVKRLTAELSKKSTSSSELADLQNDAVVSNDRAEDMQRERDEAKNKLDIVARSLERHLKTERAIRKELSASQIYNSELKLEMKSRLQEWDVEKQALLHEMELRSKMLLIEWGRNEVGPAPPGRPQGYKYKYVQALD
jgi:chromosome segregation ATPase